MKRQVDAGTVFLPAGTVIRRAAFRTNYNIICICEDLSADDAFFSGVYSHSVSLFSKCFFNNFFRCIVTFQTLQMNLSVSFSGFLF